MYRDFHQKLHQILPPTHIDKDIVTTVLAKVPASVSCIAEVARLVDIFSHNIFLTIIDVWQDKWSFSSWWSYLQFFVCTVLRERWEVYSAVGDKIVRYYVV